ncbi:MAG: hypothetical protein ABSD96_01130 [Candidatus Korobacteraceae bacterium]|jgi:hypothetical protein
MKRSFVNGHPVNEVAGVRIPSYASLTPTAPEEARVHGTPGYPFGLTTGFTWRFE